MAFHKSSSIGIFFAIVALGQPPAKRPLKLDDLAKFREIRDARCSPDGASVAFTVSAIDTKEDKSVSHIWMLGFSGAPERQLTYSAESESSPRWSPDGKFLAFTSSRPGTVKGNQVWLLNSSGGEASQLTNIGEDVKGKLQSFEWSPDSKRLALVIADPDPEADANEAAKEKDKDAKPKPQKPIVIDRYRFKQDGEGYLLSGRQSYIYLFDIATRKTTRLTKGKWNESSPVWSPDGLRIAFVSNHEADPDREPDAQLFVADAVPGAMEKQLTTAANRVRRSRPDWSPDGKTIAILEGDDKKYDAYNMNHLVTVASDGSKPAQRLAAVEALDRSVTEQRFTADGSAIRFLVIDNRSVYPAKVTLASGKIEQLLKPPVAVSGWDTSGACSIVLAGGDGQYAELHAFENGGVRQLSHRNDAVMAELKVAQTEDVNFKSKDGTEIGALLTYPLDYVKGTKVPLLLRIHGGPNGQDQHSWSTERQLLAASGYAVLAVNYRGSDGRGKKFSRAIFADWGHLEVEDLHAGVDYVIKMGVADPARLGVGGWSYGGILTDYLIASDTRFKAAASGAGTAFTVSYYGVDHYIIQYDNEIGPPWNPKSWETYQKLSYPFLHADRIKTPTLFLCGEKDFNVPLSGSEQMYQALRSLGVETRLIIYPGENHGIRRPSYVRDRYERYIDWYDKFLKAPKAAESLSNGN